MKKITLLMIVTCLSLYIGKVEAGTWTQKTDFAGGSTYGNWHFEVSIGSKGYMGLSDNNFYEWWAYDPSNNSWSQKANYTGTSNSRMAGFSIGTKAYVGFGLANGTTRTNQFYEYDATGNTWTSKTTGPSARDFARGFTIGTKGYICMGSGDSGSKNDLWEYDPSGNSWTQKTNFPGTARELFSVFVIGSYAYAGAGASQSGSFFKDFYRYDPSSNAWTPIADFGGNYHRSGICFAIGSYGYVGWGTNGAETFQPETYKYDPSSNTWSLDNTFTGPYQKYLPGGMVINNKFYTGAGASTTVPNSKSFWQYSVPITTTFTGSADWTSAGNWDNGVPTSIDIAIINGVCDITGTATCNNLTINDTRSLALSSGSLTVAGTFTINSSASGTGLFKNSAGLYIGAITVQRYLSANKWHYVSSPITAATAGVFSGLNLKSFNPTLSSNGLFEYISSGTQALTVGRGYAAKASSNTTVSFTGTLNSTSLVYANTAGKFILIGNPFPCNVDWAFCTRNRTTEYIYLWNGLSYTVPAQYSGIIPAGQGFFVESDVQSGNVGIPVTAQTLTPQSFYKSTASSSDMLHITSTKGLFEQETRIHFDQDATNNYDNHSDAHLLSCGNPDVPEIYTTTPDNHQLCVNKLAVSSTNISVPLSVNSGAGEITFHAENIADFSPNTDVTLEDLTTHQMINLRTNPSYTFTHDGTTTGRFMLHFGNASGVENNSKNAISVYSNNSSVYVNNVSETGTVTVYNMLGQVVATQKLTDGVNKISMNAASTSYIVNVKTATQNVNQKVVIVK